MSLKYRKSLVISKSRAKPFRTIRATRASRKYFTKKHLFRAKLKTLIILIILLAGIVIYLLFFSAIFRIKNVKITKINDNNLVSETELKNTIYSLMDKKSLFVLSRANLFLFESGALTKILEKDSRVESFKIKKKLPGRLEIEIGESRPAAVLFVFGDDQSYYLNSNGQIILTVPDEDFTTPDDQTEKLPKFYDQGSVSLVNPAYTKVLKEALGFMASEKIAQNGVSINLVKIWTDSGIFDLELTTSEGWQIKINSEADFAKQLAVLDLVLRDKIKAEEREVLKYIDLRFGEKIFYKLKTAE